MLVLDVRLTFEERPDGPDAAARLELLRDGMAVSRRDPGNHQYRISADLGDPLVFHIFEVWDDAAALQGHIDAPHGAAGLPTLRAAGLVQMDAVLYEAGAPQPQPSPL